MWQKLDVLTFIASLVAWTFAIITLRTGLWTQDLSAVYVAAWLWANDHKDAIYSAPPGFFGGISDTWVQLLTPLAISELGSFPYVYPPLWPALLSPIATALSPQAFSDIVLNLHIPMLAASVALAGRLAKPKRMPWFVWGGLGLIILSFSTPAAHAILHNQPTITITFLTLLAMERLQSNHPVTSGALLALAAAIKLAPVVFVLVLLLDRNRRACIAFAATGTLLLASSILAAGWQLHIDFLALLDKMRGQSIVGMFNPTLGNALLSLSPTWDLPLKPDGRPPVVTIPSELAWALRLLALSAVMAFGIRLHKIDRHERIMIATTALGIAYPLFGTVGWQHYYILPLLLLPGIVARMSLPRGALLCVLLSIAASYPFYSLMHTLAGTRTDLAVAPLACGWLAVLTLLYTLAYRLKTARDAQKRAATTPADVQIRY